MVASIESILKFRPWINSENPRIPATTNTNQSTALARSVTVSGERYATAKTKLSHNVTKTNEKATDQSPVGEETTSKLRTFRGWKRDPTNLDRPRLTRGLLRSNVSD